MLDDLEKFQGAVEEHQNLMYKDIAKYVHDIGQTGRYYLIEVC